MSQQPPGIRNDARFGHDHDGGSDVGSSAGAGGGTNGGPVVGASAGGAGGGAGTNGGPDANSGAGGAGAGVGSNGGPDVNSGAGGAAGSRARANAGPNAVPGAGANAGLDAKPDAVPDERTNVTINEYRAARFEPGNGANVLPGQMTGEDIPIQPALRLLPELGLRVKVTVLVVGVTLLVLAVFAAWEREAIRRQEEKQLQQVAHLLSVRCAQLLLLPLWNLDPAAARSIIVTEMEDARVQAITVHEAEGERFFEGMQRDAQWRLVPWTGNVPDGLVMARKPLVMEGVTLGYVDVLVSHRLLDASLGERLQQELLKAAILAVTLAGILVVLFRHILVEPITRLAATAREVSREENFSLRAPRHGDDEIGVLIDSFNAMLDQIERRNRLLNSRRRSLEREVTERTAELEEARERAEAASRAKGTFLAAVTHELRTPMTAILGLTEIALDTTLTPRQRDYLEIVRSSARTLIGVVNGVLDYSRLEAGKLVLESLPFAVRELMEEVTDLFQGRMSGKDVELLLDIEPSVPTHVVGDALRLKQVLINLVGNAFKFTRQGEVVIRVTATRVDGHVELGVAVRDTGIGIAPEARDRLFHLFAQADASTARKFGGTGLGLAIVRELVRCMGGDIDFDSVPGQGSIFRFTVRLTLPEHEASPVHPSAELDGLLALLVESHPVAARIGCSLLAACGLRSDSQPSLPDAFAALAQRAVQPAVLVLGDGLGKDVLALLTNHRRSGHSLPPVLLTIPFGMDVPAHVLQEAGVAEVLTRPVKLGALRAALLRMVAGQRDVQGATGAAALAYYPSTRVLLVEDNEVSRMVAREMLHMHGVEVIEAASGQEALSLFVGSGVDMVFMDIQMPGMDGFAATRALREMQSGISVPIVAFTAHGMVEELAGFREAGFSDYLMKPVERDALATLLHRWFAGREQLRQQLPPQDVVSPVSVDATVARSGEAVSVCGCAPVALPGLDVQGGLTRMGGRIWLYHKVLASFVEAYSGVDTVLQRLASEQDYVSLAERAHTIAGAAANISADALADVTRSIELLTRTNAPDAQQVDELVARFAELLDQLLESIARLQDELG